MQKSLLIFKVLYCHFSVLLKDKTSTSLTYFTACILGLKALQIQIDHKGEKNTLKCRGLVLLDE